MADVTEEQPAPLVLVKGDATAEEVAALVAVLQAAAVAAAPAEPPRRRSLWADPARQVRRTHRPGPGAWRATSLP